MRRPKIVKPPTKALQDVLAERKRQIAKGWTPEHDDGHTNGWIANAAADMLMMGQHCIPGSWAWKHKHPDSPERKSRRDQLVIGAAMALAEIERIDRAVRAGRDPFPQPKIQSTVRRPPAWPGGRL